MPRLLQRVPGMKVDRIVRIEEQRVNVGTPPRPMMAMRAEAQAPTDAGRRGRARDSGVRDGDGRHPLTQLLTRP